MVEVFEHPAIASIIMESFEESAASKIAACSAVGASREEETEVSSSWKSSSIVNSLFITVHPFLTPIQGPLIFLQGLHRIQARMLERLMQELKALQMRTEKASPADPFLLQQEPHDRSLLRHIRA